MCTTNELDVTEAPFLQVAILKCVMKEMASQVTARKRLQFPTKIMTRSVGLQVNQTSGADKDLKVTLKKNNYLINIQTNPFLINLDYYANQNSRN